jgi:hypothetical protein
MNENKKSHATAYNDVIVEHLADLYTTYAARAYLDECLEIYRDEETGRPGVLVSFGGPTTRMEHTGHGWVRVSTWWDEEVHEEVHAEALAEVLEEYAEDAAPYELWKERRTDAYAFAELAEVMEREAYDNLRDTFEAEVSTTARGGYFEATAASPGFTSDDAEGLPVFVSVMYYPEMEDGTHGEGVEVYADEFVLEYRGRESFEFDQDPSDIGQGFTEYLESTAAEALDRAVETTEV